jgi:hypothetical protein
MTAKSANASESMTPSRLSLFGSPPLLEREDPKAYDDLLAQVPLEDYLRLWQASCAEIHAPGLLPARLAQSLCAR